MNQLPAVRGGSRPRVLFVVTEDWYFCSHRLPLAKWLIETGFHVSVATARGSNAALIGKAGVEHHVLRLNRSGHNPSHEWNAIQDIERLCRRVRPDILHLVGLKPILYGSIAAQHRSVPSVVCAVAGLGSLFAPGGLRRRMLRTAVRGCYRRYIYGREHVKVIVQNPDDRAQLIERGMVSPVQIATIHGSGVDLQRFQHVPDPGGEPVVFTHSRMLWDKGIGQLVDASRLLKQRGVDCRFVLAGLPDPANPSSIPVEQLQQWNDEGAIQWLGKRQDIPELLAASHIACLPSYYGEGIPLSLIEAAASGRPIVTTNMPGCREVVRTNKNGRLVPARQVAALADALQELVNDQSLRSRMGSESRLLAEREFGIDVVRQDTWRLYQQALTESADRVQSEVRLAHRKTAA